MNVRFLEAKDVARELPKLISSCDELLIAMAYVKINGLKHIMPELVSLLSRGASLKIIFGLSHAFGVTDKESAKELFDLSKHKNAEVHKFNNPGFHPKLFIFQKQNPSVLIGSSNITESAQSTNSEANVLIENPDQEFLENVNLYFYRHLSDAPILSKTDISQYNPPKILIKKKKRRKIPIDHLPTPLTIINEVKNLSPPTLWKISPGQDASHWKNWYEAINEKGNGVIALGWDIGDLERINQKEEARKKVRINAKQYWNRGRKRKVSVGYATNQLWMLKEEIQTEDLVVIYSRRRIFGIAEVLEKSPYTYKYLDSIDYPNQLKVRYLWYHYWPEPSEQKIINTLGKQGTLKRIEEKWVWDYIKNHYFARSMSYPRDLSSILSFRLDDSFRKIGNLPLYAGSKSTLVGRWSKRYENQGLDYWYGLKARDLLLVKQHPVTHFAYVCANEGVVLLPKDLVLKHVDAGNLSKSLISGNLMHYHMKFRNEEDGLIWKVAQGILENVEEYYVRARNY